MPPSAMARLEGPTRGQDTGKVEPIGCFTPQSKKAKNVSKYATSLELFVDIRIRLWSYFSLCSQKQVNLSTLSEVSRIPKGVEWLWHPQIVNLYNRVLRQCEINSTTREAAAGALQNITAGDKRVSITIKPLYGIGNKSSLWFINSFPAVGISA